MGTERNNLTPLPIRRGATAPEASRPPGGNQRHVRVLIVEDLPDVARSLEMLLRLCGYEVCVQNSGLKGLEAAQTFQPHIAILDIGLPELNGWQLASRLRNLLGKKTPVLIAHSGYGTPEDQERSAAAGFDYHLVKSCSPDDLLALLRQAAGE
jgi:CheY-like chemotaxis protein